MSDFFQRYNWEEVQAFTAEFVGVKKSTVLAWSRGNLPNGEKLVIMRVLLDMVGYKVAEFEVLSPATRQFAQLIAFGEMTVEEAREQLDYTNINGVFDLLLRASGMYPDRVYRLERYVERSSTELESLVADARLKIEQLTQLEPSGPTEEPTPPGEAVAPAAPNERPSPPVGAVSVPAPQAVAFDTTTLAHALVNTVTLLTSLAQAIDASPGNAQLRGNVLFALGERNVEVAIKALEAIRNP